MYKELHWFLYILVLFDFINFFFLNEHLLFCFGTEICNK